MKGLYILRVDLVKIISDVFESWAQLYCEIWKEPPWNEEFWNAKSVKMDFVSELSRLHGEAFLAIDNCTLSFENPDGIVFSRPGQKTVGFTHGYSVSCYEMRMIAGSGILNFLFKKDQRVYYIDELGVAKDYRGQHISLMLTKLMLQTISSHGIKTVALKTDKDAAVARSLYMKLGFKEVVGIDAKYPNRTYWVLQL